MSSQGCWSLSETAFHVFTNNNTNFTCYILFLITKIIMNYLIVPITTFLDIGLRLFFDTKKIDQIRKLNLTNHNFS